MSEVETERRLGQVNSDEVCYKGCSIWSDVMKDVIFLEWCHTLAWYNCKWHDIADQYDCVWIVTRKYCTVELNKLMNRKYEKYI